MVVTQGKKEREGADLGGFIEFVVGSSFSRGKRKHLASEERGQDWKWSVLLEGELS